MGISPLELKLPKNRDPVIVEIRYPGYRTLKEQIVPDVDQRLRLTLTAVPRTAPATTASANPYHRFD